MNEKNGQNSLGLDVCFEDSANPIDLFKKWFAVAEKRILSYFIIIPIISITSH